MNQQLEAVSPSVEKRPNPRRKSANSDLKWALLLLIPLFVGIGLIYYSAIFGFVMSFTSWDIVRSPQWIGLENYTFMIHDQLFWKAMWNTTFFTMLTVPLKMIIGLGIALLCNQGLKGSNFFKLAFFFPAACSVVAIAMLWGYIYSNTGILNTILAFIGYAPVHWLNAENALISIAMMSVWAGMGYTALLFLAGLQNIPQEYYEASVVDGASKFKQLIKITIPLLSPTTFFVLVISLITSLQTFGEVYILQGPVNSTLTIVQYIFNEAFASFRMGYASAIAYLLIVTIFIITIIQLKLQKKWVHYDL